MAGKSEYYAYVHIRTDSGIPFYVGKGKQGRAFCKKNRNEHWKNVASKGYRVEFLTESIDEELAFLVEIEAIDIFRKRGFVLCNYTNGGEGISGFSHSEETKKKMSIGNIGKHNFKHTEEAKQKISITSKGREISELTRKRQSESSKGKPKSEKHKYNIAKARTGTTLSENAKVKLSNKTWITDGVNSYFVDKNLPLPPGMYYGRTFKNRKGK